MKTNSIISLAVAASLFSLSGCATLINGRTQTIAVAATDASGASISAACDLSNKSGKWSVVTPSKIEVHRAYDPLLVQCQQPGASFKDLSVDSKLSLLVFLTPTMPGVGVAIDASTGGAYNYPDTITVQAEKP